MSGMTAKTAMRGLLALQLGLGGLMVAGDLEGGLALWPGTERAPQLETPVRPGDQTRRFTPNDLPQPLRAPDAPPLPERLVLTTLEDGTVLLEGGIAGGDAERLADDLNAAAPTRVRLNSPGGSVTDALALGRQIRALGAETVLEAGDVCLSACPYLLAGGTARTVDPNAMVGVHQHYFGESTILPAFVAVEDIQRGQGEVMAYLVEMDIDPRLMQHALVTPPDEIYLLVPEELTTYRLATGTPDAA